MESLIHLVEFRIDANEAAFHLNSIDRGLLVTLLLVNVAWSVAVSSSCVGLKIIVLGSIEAIRVVSLMDAGVFNLESVEGIAEACGVHLLLLCRSKGFTGLINDLSDSLVYRGISSP